MTPRATSVPVVLATPEAPCDFCVSLEQLADAFDAGLAHLCPDHAGELYRFAAERGLHAEAAAIAGAAFADPHHADRMRRWEHQRAGEQEAGARLTPLDLVEDRTLAQRAADQDVAPYPFGEWEA